MSELGYFCVYRHLVKWIARKEDVPVKYTTNWHHNIINSFLTYQGLTNNNWKITKTTCNVFNELKQVQRTLRWLYKCTANILQKLNVVE